MYSTCLAQVVADNKYPGRLRGQEQQWYDAYVDALQHLGWSIREFQYVPSDPIPYRTPETAELPRCSRPCTGSPTSGTRARTAP